MDAFLMVRLDRVSILGGTPLLALAIRLDGAVYQGINSFRFCRVLAEL